MDLLRHIIRGDDVKAAFEASLGPQWRVHDFVPYGGLTVIRGRRGQIARCAFEIAAHVAAGHEWRGHRVLQARALYAWHGAAERHERNFDAWGAIYGRPAELYVSRLPWPGLTGLALQLQGLATAAVERNIGLLVVTAHGGFPVRPLFNFSDALTERGIATMLLTPEPPLALQGACDALLTVAPDRRGRPTLTAQLKDHPEPLPIALTPMRKHQRVP